MDPTDQHLIEFVEKCPHLYNKSSPDYRDKIKAQNSWCNIAEAFNATGMYICMLCYHVIIILFIYLFSLFIL